MAWSCRSHSPPWSQIGQSSGWLISRNSITPSRAFLTIGVSVLIRSEEHTSELQSLMRISYAVFCLKKKQNILKYITTSTNTYKDYPVNLPMNDIIRIND